MKRILCALKLSFASIKALPLILAISEALHLWNQYGGSE
jgi:hypothetical protein